MTAAPSSLPQPRPPGPGRPRIETIIIVAAIAIVVVLVIGVTVFLSATESRPGTSPPSSTAIGTAFNAGNPFISKCPTGETYNVSGCTAGDYTYTLTVESSTVTFGSLEFEVVTSTGAILELTGINVGSFALENVDGVAVATSGPSALMAMTGPFSTYNAASGACGGTSCTPSSPLTTLYTIVIDMGTVNPAGQGYTFVAVGIGSYSGTTAPLFLP